MIDRSPTHVRTPLHIFLSKLCLIVKKGVAEGQDYCIIARKDLKIPVTYEES